MPSPFPAVDCRTCRTALLGLLLFAWAGVAISQQTQIEVPAAKQSQKTPPWAYPLLPSTAPPAVTDDGVAHTLAGSKLSFTRIQLFDLYAAVDWFPESHSPMPEVVAHGRKPEVRACGMCHYPNGQGRPENAALAGLPASYIIQQIQDYKSGLRRSSEPQAGPHVRMLSTASHVSDEDVAEAAQYFSAQKYQPWIRVVETDKVPLTRVVVGSMWAAVSGEEREPIGRRIVEVPNDYASTELRDSRSGFTAYVPLGSVNRGQSIATMGNGKTTACITCHGVDLKGLGSIPPLAGRSSQYLFRQLYDMQKGSRAGAAALAMRDVVAHLSEDDMIAVVSYASSLAP